MTLAIGNGQQQAWPPKSSGPLNNAGVSRNFQSTCSVAPEWFAGGKLPAVDGDLQPNVKGCCFSIGRSCTSQQFTAKFQNVAGISVLSFKEHTCSFRMPLLRTLLEKHLKATRVGEDTHTHTHTAEAQCRVVTSPAFSPNANNSLPKGHCDLFSHYFPLSTLKDGRNYNIVICFFHFR